MVSRADARQSSGQLNCGQGGGGRIAPTVLSIDPPRRARARLTGQRSVHSARSVTALALFISAASVSQVAYFPSL
ncbi:MAG: hypothetical protein ACYCT1_15520 [Steroidobacteraceae bacterium]